MLKSLVLEVVQDLTIPCAGLQEQKHTPPSWTHRLHHSRVVEHKLAFTPITCIL